LAFLFPRINDDALSNSHQVSMIIVSLQGVTKVRRITC